MQIFVGNPTLQHREFHYRRPGQKTTRVVRIAAGGQERLPDDLSGADLKNVVDQLERCGAVPAGEVSAIVLPKQLIYEVSPNPIKEDQIAEGMERDEEARQEVSAEKLEEAGLGTFNSAQATVRGTKLVETSVEIVETTDRGPVKDGVNAEFVVSTKPNRRAGKMREETKT